MKTTLNSFPALIGKPDGATLYLSRQNLARVPTSAFSDSLSQGFCAFWVAREPQIL